MRLDMKIQLLLEDAKLTATLINGSAARDLVSLLPLEVSLRDYAAKEKVGDLPRRLTTESEPGGMKPDVGDITYYAPWGNLAIFYRDFGYAHGLVKLGRIDSGIEKLASRQGEFVVRIEQAEQVR